MAYVLLPDFFARAVDANGNPYSGAKLNVYLTGTTTPTNSYQTSAGTAHANPVVSDSAGHFEPIFLDPTVTYRLLFTTSGGSTIEDFDPYIPVQGISEASGAQVTAGTATDVFISPRRAGAGGVTLVGYTPANKAGETFTGAVKLNYTNSTGNVQDVGLRHIAWTTKDSDSTLAMDDAGKGWRHTSGSAHAWTIPPESSVAWPEGAAIALVNSGSGAVTLTRGSGVALRIAGSSSDGNKTFAQYGMATLVKVGTDSWYVSGSGLS